MAFQCSSVQAVGWLFCIWVTKFIVRHAWLRMDPAKADEALS